MSKPKNHDHLTSLRLPIELHQWVIAYAKRVRVSPAYIYRHALWNLKEKVTSNALY